MGNDSPQPKFNLKRIFSFEFEVDVIYPLLLVGVAIVLIASGPNIYQHYFVDSKYCIGTKEDYQRYFESKIRGEKISRIYQDGEKISLFGGSIYSGFMMESCASKSIGLNTLTVNQISEGDSIFKSENSNEFTILKAGQRYVFEIDRLRNLDGTEEQ